MPDSKFKDMTYLFLGSFNPVHKAHRAAVEWALNNGADEVWVVVSPQNPLKNSDSMAPLKNRVEMVEMAMQNLDKVKVVDFEKNLPEPHYTIDAIEYLMKKYPDEKFSILCGSDIMEQLPRWHKSEELRMMVDFVEYPRTILPVSSTEIRNGDKLELVDDKVLSYIASHNLYPNRLEIAKKHFAIGAFGDALNELNMCEGDEAQTLKDMIHNILAFRNTDIYNP